jgi:hypothetical protein
MTDSNSSSPSPSPSHGGFTSIWVIDQIENGVAAVEINGDNVVTMPVEVLPKGIREGDVLRVAILQDPEELARRLALSAAQVAKGGKGGKGNITL